MSPGSRPSVLGEILGIDGRTVYGPVCTGWASGGIDWFLLPVAPCLFTAPLSAIAFVPGWPRRVPRPSLPLPFPHPLLTGKERDSTPCQSFWTYGGTELLYCSAVGFPVNLGPKVSPCGIPGRLQCTDLVGCFLKRRLKAPKALTKGIIYMYIFFIIIMK